MLRRRRKLGLGVVLVGVAVIASVGAVGVIAGGTGLIARAAAPPTEVPGAPTSQTLAERLLVGGAPGVSVQLLPGQWPTGLPLEPPAPPSARLIGSAAHVVGGQVQLVDGVLDADGAPADILNFYEQALAGHGWKMAPFGGTSPVGGFQPTSPAGNGRNFCQSPSGPALTVTAYAQPNAATDVRLRLSLVGPGPCGPPPAPPTPVAAVRTSAETLPALHAPDGTPLQITGITGGPSRWTSEATAQTKLSAAELEAHFSQQLQAAGWTRLAGAGDGTVAWSTWKLPREGDWQGLLMVLPSRSPDRRDLLLRAEGPAPAPPAAGAAGGMSLVQQVTTQAQAVAVRAVDQRTLVTPSPTVP